MYLCSVDDKLFYVFYIPQSTVPSPFAQGLHLAHWEWEHQ